MNNQSTTEKQIFHGDPEHSGLRAVVMVTVIISFVLFYNGFIAYFTGDAAEMPDHARVLSCLGALPIALAIMGVVEFFLKQRWSSGNFIALEKGGISQNERTGQQTFLHGEQPATMLAWYFPLTGYARSGRERRIAAGWFCAAVQLTQDNKRINFHAYIPPRKESLVTESTPFQQLDPAEIYGRKKRVGLAVHPEITSKILAGANGRYWLAEKNRWQHSLELTADDFIQLTKQVTNQLTPPA